MQSEALKSTSASLKALLLGTLPRSMQELLRELRSLSGRERRAHLRTAVHRLAARPDAIPASLQAGDSVLFVCYGNIIRSALAEALFRRHGTARGLDCARLRSAGLAARPGRGADPRAVDAGYALGVDLSAHRARPLSPDLVAEADVIYVMDRLNEAQVVARFPEARRKVRRLGALMQTNRSDVIADPYVLDAAAVAAVAARIDRATQVLAETLANRQATKSGVTP